eukprot:gene26205-34826_t
MLNPAFNVKLGQQILSGLVVTGKFDGQTPSLACATTGGKIILHSPHDVEAQRQAEMASGQISSLKFLNLNRKITSLAAGSLGPIVDNALISSSSNKRKPDLIFVGTQSNLLAYDVERNADSFFVEVQDGVNAMVVGKMNPSSKPLVLTGGNCSILGFDAKGMESFWTVTGDNVSSLALGDLESGQGTLWVGSDDFEIRIFRNEEVVNEITEADKFAYGLANGTVGVYSTPKTRLWRVKTKNKVTALYTYDLDLDGVPEVFSGWSNGTFTVRRQENEFGAMFESGVGKDNASDQKMLSDLQNQKLELTAEIKLLEKTQKPITKTTELAAGQLPGNTALSYALEADVNAASVTLKVEVNTDVQIMNLIAVDLEGVVLVDREVIAISPRAQSKIALHVFETDVTLPRFAVFKQLSDASYNAPPAAKVVFLLKGPLRSENEQLHLQFVSVCDVGVAGKGNPTSGFIPVGQSLYIDVTRVKDSGGSASKVKVQCLSMELASDIVQDIVRFFKISELESEADFPAELAQFEEVLKIVADCNANRLR